MARIPDAFIDDLLARSRNPGEMVARRSFALSREKAIEKMREFSLRHPKQYVLELIQAAVFAKASWVAIDISDSHLLLAFVGGKRLEEHQLENVFDYLFSDQATAKDRHLMQLAIGLNAILQRNPTTIRIESGDGTPENTVRMEMDSDGNGVMGTPATGLNGTYLMVEFEQGWFSRFFGGDGATEEVEVIEKRCLYAPVPILLNGDAPFGYRAARQLDCNAAVLSRQF